MHFADPTFLDMVVRRRANYKISNPDNKTRLCWLIADAVTRRIEGDLPRVLALQEWVGEALPHVIGHDIRGVSDMYRVHALDVISRGWAACEATSDVFADALLARRLPGAGALRPAQHGGAGHRPPRERSVCGRPVALLRRRPLAAIRAAGRQSCVGSRPAAQPGRSSWQAEAARDPEAQPKNLPGAQWAMTDGRGREVLPQALPGDLGAGRALQPGRLLRQVAACDAGDGSLSLRPAAKPRRAEAAEWAAAL